MKATIVELRYKMKEILKALDRNENITIMYHGKPRGIISPIREGLQSSVEEHPFFGMDKNNDTPVEEIMNSLRGDRHNVI